MASWLIGGVGTLVKAENGGVGCLVNVDRSGSGGVGSLAGGGWNSGVEGGRGLRGVDWAKLEVADWVKILDRLAAGLGGSGVVVGTVPVVGGGKGTVPVLFPSLSPTLCLTVGTAPCLVLTQ